MWKKLAKTKKVYYNTKKYKKNYKSCKSLENFL